MSEEQNVDRLVDKAIDEALGKADKGIEEIKKRKPSPSFRYLTDKKEIEAELNKENTPITVMKKRETLKIVEDDIAILGLGDVQTIENVIKKHEASRKIR